MRTAVPSRDLRAAPCEICGEVRARLNYCLCCHLPANHCGEHRWTPEDSMAKDRAVACPRCNTTVRVACPPVRVERLGDGTGTQHVVIRDRELRILHECGA